MRKSFLKNIPNNIFVGTRIQGDSFIMKQSLYQKLLLFLKIFLLYDLKSLKNNIFLKNIYKLNIKYIFFLC